VIDWLASYPKSGNTWMRLLLANYFSETDQPHDINQPGVTNGIASSRWRFDEMLGLDSSDLTDDEIDGLLPSVFETMVARNPAPQWIKVHDAQRRLSGGQWLFPPHVSGTVIYLIRNPLDVAVSRAFHDGHGDMARAVAMLCDPLASVSGGGKQQLRQHMGDWSAHVNSWTLQDDIPVKVVRYEDMLEDAGRELAAVIAFARPDEAVDPVRIRLAVEHTRFEALQAAEAVQGFRETTARQDRFFRSGKAGDWVSHLSPGQVELLWHYHREVMERFGYSPAPGR
jgi:hypothetical protein